MTTPVKKTTDAEVFIDEEPRDPQQHSNSSEDDLKVRSLIVFQDSSSAKTKKSQSQTKEDPCQEPALHALGIVPNQSQQQQQPTTSTTKSSLSQEYLKELLIEILVEILTHDLANKLCTQKTLQSSPSPSFRDAVVRQKTMYRVSHTDTLAGGSLTSFIKGCFLPRVWHTEYLTYPVDDLKPMYTADTADLIYTKAPSTCKVDSDHGSTEKRIGIRIRIRGNPVSYASDANTEDLPEKQMPQHWKCRRKKRLPPKKLSSKPERGDSVLLIPTTATPVQNIHRQTTTVNPRQLKVTKLSSFPVMHCSGKDSADHLWAITSNVPDVTLKALKKFLAMARIHDLDTDITAKELSRSSERSSWKRQNLLWPLLSRIKQQEDRVSQSIAITH
ncbi:hypothetical protein U1Q18_051696 [Sarracenia purpurea var. burkii]